MLQNQIKCYVLWYGMNFFEGYVILGIRYLICYGYFTFRNNQQFIFASILVIGFYSFFCTFFQFTFLLLQTCVLGVAKSVEMTNFFLFIYCIYLKFFFHCFYVMNGRYGCLFFLLIVG